MDYIPWIRCVWYAGLDRRDVIIFEATRSMVTVGEEGFYSSGSVHIDVNPDVFANLPKKKLWTTTSGQDFIQNHNLTAIDYAAIHSWPDDWAVSSQSILVEEKLNAQQMSKGRCRIPIMLTTQIVQTSYNTTFDTVVATTLNCHFNSPDANIDWIVFIFYGDMHLHHQRSDSRKAATIVLHCFPAKQMRSGSSFQGCESSFQYESMLWVPWINVSYQYLAILLVF